MAKKWADVVASSDYQQLSPEDKEAVRQGYFESVIAPKIPENEREAARAAFDIETRDQERSELEPPAEAPRSAARELAGDIGTALGIGVRRAASDLGEIVRHSPIPVVRGIVTTTEAAGRLLGLPTGEEGRRLEARKIRELESEYSPEFQAAGRKQWWDEENNTFGDAWGDWRAYVKGITESLPEQVLTMYPAMRLAKGAYLTKLAQTGDEVLAAKSAANTAQLVGGLGEGALAGAATSREVREQIDAIPDEQLRKSDAIKALMQQGMSFAQAKRAITDDAAAQAFLLAGLGTGLFAGMGDRVLAKAMFGGSDKLLARALKGMVGEGALEEFPQSFGEKVAENVAMRKVEPDRPLTRGALNEAFGGLAIGGVQGGAQSAIFGRSSARQAAAGLAPVDVGEVLEEPAPEQPEQRTMTFAPRRGMTDTSNMRDAPPEITETDAGEIDTQLQNRQRERAVSVAQMAEIAANPDFDRLAESPIPDVGAPMVSVAADQQIPGAVLGKQSNVTLPDGNKIPVQYAVMEADQVLASHAVNGARNERYFAAPQPGEVRALTNGRVAGLQEAYVRNNTQDYRQKLTERAQEFGLDPQAIASMRAPMLVRVYPDEVNKLPGIARLSNTGGSARLSPLETAVNDAEAIRSLDALEFAENGDINVPANRQFFRAFVQQVVPKQEWPEVMDAAGRLNATGLARIRNAILVKAFGRSEAVLRVLDSADDNVRRITAALVRVAPRVARARELAEAGQLFPIEIIEDVVAAVEEISRIRSEGKTIAQVLAQMTLVDRPYSDETVEILRFLDDANRAGSRLTAFINAYLDELEKYGPQGEDMFGAKAAPDKGAVARTKIKEVLDDEKRVQGSAGSGAAQPAAEPAKPSSGAGTQAASGTGEPGRPARSEPAREEGRARRGEERERPEVVPAPKETDAEKKREAKKRAARVPAASGLPKAEKAAQDGAKPTEDKPAAAPKKETIAPEPSPEEKAKEDLRAALADLGDILGKNVRKNITPEQEQKLLPVLTRIFDAAFRLGHIKFKQAARFVRDEIRQALGAEVEALLTIDHYQGAYIGMSGKYRDKGAETAAQVAKITDKGMFSDEGFAGLLDKEETFSKQQLENAWGFAARFPRERPYELAIANLEREYADAERKLREGMPGIPDEGKPGAAEALARRARLVRALLRWAKENRDKLEKTAEPEPQPELKPEPKAAPAQKTERPKERKAKPLPPAMLQRIEEANKRARAVGIEFRPTDWTQGVGVWDLSDDTMIGWDQLKHIDAKWFDERIRKRQQETAPEEKADAPPRQESFRFEDFEQAAKGKRVSPSQAMEGEFIEAPKRGARASGIEIRNVRDHTGDFDSTDPRDVFGTYPVIKDNGELFIDQYESGPWEFQGTTADGKPAWKDANGTWALYDAENNLLEFGAPEPAIVSKAPVAPLPGTAKLTTVPSRDVDAAASEAAASPTNALPAPSTPQAEAGNYKKGHIRLHGLDISIENPRDSWRHGYDTTQVEALAAEARQMSLADPRRHHLLEAAGYFRKGEVPAAVRALEGAITAARNQGHEAMAESIERMLERGWHARMPTHYGYIRRAKGADGDHVDVFIGPDPDYKQAWIINQRKPLDAGPNAPEAEFDEHKVMLGFRSADAAVAAYLGSFADDFGRRVFQSISPSMSIDVLKEELPKLKKARPVAAEKGGRTITPEASDENRVPGVQRPSEAGNLQGDLFAAPPRPADSRPLVPEPSRDRPEDGARRDADRQPEGAVRVGDEGSGGERQPGSVVPGGSREDGAVRPAARTVSTPAVQPPSNYIITPADDLGSGGAKTKFRDNLAAIRLLKQLQREQRLATADEQRVLVRYVGWGGLKEVFDRDNNEWAAERAQLAEVLSKDEFDAARRSVQDAHYTSTTVIQGIYEGLARLGVKGNVRVLEPSVGIGHFFGLMPESMRGGAMLFGIELDPTSAAIAKQLYQRAEIINRGLQDVPIPEGYFDLAIGNPPFGEQRITDEHDKSLSGKTIHNYFFAKSMKALRPGGILAMVVSRYYMDKASPIDREEMARQARFLGGIRLPNTAFKQNARTEVTTDILFFQKWAQPGSIGREGWWVDTRDVHDPESGNPIRINRYFADHPGQMLGTMTLAGTMYREGEPTLEPREGLDLAEGIREALKRLPENVYTEIPDEQRVSFQYDTEGVVPSDAKVDAYFELPDGRIARRLADQLAFKRYEVVEAEGRTAERIKGLIKLRGALADLMAAELQEGVSDLRLSTLRGALNRVYDDFRRKYGYVNDRANRLAFRDDPVLPLLEALEPNYQPAISKEVAARNDIQPRPASADKADIFKRRVLQPWKPPTSAASAKEALVHSLNMRGGVDLDYMARLYGKDPQAIAAELAGVIYLNPEGGWETAEQYLSGNVKAKLEKAKAAAATDQRFEDNVRALEKVIPPDIDALDINVSLGSPWVPSEDMKDFVQHLLGVRPSEFRYLPQVGSWAISIRWTQNEAFMATWGTKRMPAHEIIAHLANGEAVVVYDTFEVDGQEKRIKNEKETEAAQVKADEVARAFQDWIWSDPERRQRLARLYNDTYNTNRTREYDGSHLSFPGMSPAIQLRKHQKAVVWRMLQDRTVLLDHVVGAGKTFAVAAATMEMKRLGIAKKPMLVVPNHLVRQWRDEFYRLYPNANILVPTEKDFERKNRQRLLGRIATNDWDAVIVAHSSFLKIEPPKEAAADILREQIADIDQAVREMKAARGETRNAVRQLEKMKEKLQNKMKLLAGRGGARDQVVDFEQMGIDALVVDEAHEFKNLFYHTKMQRVAGLGTPMGSGKAFDLFVKIRFLAKRFGGKAPIGFATGTPVSNSLVEMFTMQRYLMYDELRRRNIHHLDAWAKVFGNVTNVYEVHPSGQGYRLATRFAKFVNLPELMTLYKSVADVIAMKDLKAQAEAEGKRFPVPKVKGGKPRNVVAERSERQRKFFGEEEPLFHADGTPMLNAEGAQITGWTPGSILDRIEKLPQIKDPREDNMLKITNDARKAGLDFRLIDPSAADFPGSKQNLMVAEVKRIYDEWSADKGTQLIFCDLSIPSSARGKEAEKFAVRTIGGVKIIRGRRVAVEGAPEELEFVLEKLTKPGARTAIGYRIVELHTGREIAGAEKSAETLAAAAKWMQDAEKVRELVAEAVAAEEVTLDDAEQDAEAPQDEEEGAVGIDELIAQASTFSVYDDVKAKLVAAGIPAEEIAFIHDYDTAEKKKKLYAAMNAGTIRVLMGSTFKMGAGMNVQERLVAEHHLDAPWRPSDLEQREGRILRQGNKLYERDPDGFEVEIIRYATNQTYDTRMWQLIEHKAMGVEQLRKGDNTLREIEDISGEAANASEMKAAASGNPLILEEVTLRTEIKRLEAEEYAWKRTKHARQDRLARIEDESKYFERRLARLAALRAATQPKEPFSYTAPDGKTTVTDKKNANSHLIGALAAAIKSEGSQRRSMGQYRGINLYAKRGFGGVMIEASFQGSEDYLDVTEYEKDDQFSAVGFFTRVDNFLDGIEARQAKIREQQEAAAKEAEGIRSRLDEPFTKAAELAEKRARHQRITQALKAGKKSLDESTVQEPEPVYNVAYEGVPEDGGEDRAGRRAEAPAGARTVSGYQVDLWLTEGQARGERFATTTRAVQVGTLKTGVRRVNGPEDAAHVVAPIRKEAVENGLVVVLNRRKRPIAVLRVGIGSRTEMSVFPGIIASQVHAIPGAASIWFAHNHPSGLPEPSTADELITKRIQNALAGTGIEFAGHIVMGGSRAYWFNGDLLEGLTPITKAVRHFKIPELRFVFGRQGKLAEKPATNPDAARAILRRIEDPEGVLLLDAQHNAVAWVPMSAADMAKLRTRMVGTGASKLLQAINNANATAMVLKTAARDDRAMTNMVGFSEAMDVKLLDAFYGDPGAPGALRSAAENRTLPQAMDGFFSLLGGHYVRPKAGGSTVEGVIGELRAEIGDKAAKIDVVQSWRELPDEARDLVYSRRAFDVQGWADPKTGRFVLVADNIKPGRAFAVLMHEVGVHLGLRGFIGAEAFDRLAAQITEWAAFGIGEHGRLAQAALARIPPKTPKKDRMEELVAYFIEEAVKAGYDWHKPGTKNAISSWFRRLVQAIATALSKLGLVPRSLSIEEVVALARGALEVTLSGYQDRRGKDGLLSTVWHGSPHDFDRFSTEHIGKGEGVQAFGWGLYFTSRKDIAEWYRNNLAPADQWLYEGKPIAMESYQEIVLQMALNTLTNDLQKNRDKDAVLDDAIARGEEWVRHYRARAREKTGKAAAETTRIANQFEEYVAALKAVDRSKLHLVSPGRVYQVNLAPADDEYLDWDRPLREQSDKVKAAISGSWLAEALTKTPELTGEQFYKDWLAGPDMSRAREASLALAEIGIPGIRYLDGHSRATRDDADPGYNYVIFEEDNIQIEGKFSQSGEHTAPPRRRRRFRPLDTLVRVPVQALRIDRATSALYDALIEKVGGFIPETVKAGVVSDYGLPEAVIDRRDLMFGRQRGQLRRVQNLLDKLATLTRAEAKVLYEAATTADHARVAALLEKVPEESRATLMEIKKWVHELGQEEVRLGQLAKESFERNEWAYLHRSYRKYVVEQTPQEKAARGRAVRLWADSYRGRGIEDPEGIARLRKANDAWWGRKLDRTKPDFGMVGQKFIRLERRGNRGEGVAVLPGVEASKQRGPLREVVYWPVEEELPARFKSWDQDAGQWEARVNRKGRLVMWRDFTPEERQRMGEIDDIRYAMAKTLHLGIHNVEVGRYLEWVANNYSQPEDKLPPGASKRDGNESRFVVYGKDDWVKVPNTELAGTDVKKFGKLAGLYVPGPIWNDIRHVTGHRYAPLGDMYSRLLRAWKVSKTALSPAVHMNNVMANVIMADWHDVGALDVLRALRTMVAAARGDQAAKDLIGRFEDAGGTQGLYVLSEIQREQLAPILDEIEAVMREQGENNAMVGLSAAIQLLRSGQWRQAIEAAKESLPGRASTKAIRAMMDLYEGEDRVFRLAAFMRALEDGKTDAEAGKVARKSFLDYQINAPWINLMRSTAFPFISFVYRALPMVVETAARKPWKILKLWLVLSGVNLIGYALSGGDEEEERKLLPEEKAGWVLGFLAPKLIRMPWNDEHDSPVFLDVRRWIPVGDIADVGQVHSALPVLPSMMPGGPLALLGEFLLNRSAFTGRPITKDTDTPTEAVGKVFQHFWRALAPNIAGLPGVPATQAIVNAGTGETDIFGRELSLRDALLSAIGIKVGSYPPDIARRNLRIEAGNELSEIRGNEFSIRRRHQIGDIDERERDLLLEREAEKRKRVQEAYRRKVGEGLPVD